MVGHQGGLLLRCLSEQDDFRLLEVSAGICTHTSGMSVHTVQNGRLSRLRGEKPFNRRAGRANWRLSVASAWECQACDGKWLTFIDQYQAEIVPGRVFLIHFAERRRQVEASKEESDRNGLAWRTCQRAVSK